MKKILRLLAATLLLVASTYWLAAGANSGWTKTSVPIKTVDEVTGLDHIEWQAKFVPGIDFLGLALVLGGVIAGTSLLMNNKRIGN